MARRTKDKIKKDIIAVQECTNRISADVLSLEDLAKKLNLTKEQLRHTFRCMEKEKTEIIKSRLKFLSKKAKKLKNYKNENYLTNTRLGLNERHTRGIFVNPANLNQILEKGEFVPRKDDIIYVVEHYDGKIFFKKSLVLSVEVKQNCLRVATLELLNQKFPDSKSILEIAVSSNSNMLFDGIDSYVLSKI